MNTLYKLALLHLLCGLSFSVSANSIIELEKLLNEEHNQLSDKRLNTEYKASTLTVLYGRDLSLQGIDTIAEAMNLVPGMMTGVDSDLVVRGLEKNWGSSNIMMMLNNQPVNSTLIAYPTHLLKMPVEMIERIEVVRGPDAELSTEFAISASINIITREHNSAFIKYGEFNQSTAGANYSDKNTQLNFAYSQGDDSNFRVESDALTNNPYYSANNSTISATPNIADDSYQRYYLTYLGKHQDWAWGIQRFEEQRGDAFGLAYIQPPSNAKSTKIDRTTTAHIRYKNLELGYHQFELDYQNMFLAPPGFTDLTGQTYPDGMQYSPKVSEDRWTLHYDWKVKLARHSITVRPYLTHIKANPGTVTNNMGRDTAMFNAQTNNTRKIAGLMMHNAYRYSPSTTLSYSARYDQVSDLDNTVAGHVGFVTRVDSQHHLKGYLTQSYRLPTFLEKYYPTDDPLMKGDESLESTRIRSAELMWLHDDSNYRTKLAAFFNEYDRLLTTQVLPTALNGTDPIFYQQFTQLNNKVYAKGIEFEFKTQLSDALNFDFNATLQKGDSDSTEMVRTPQWLSNTILSYRMNSQWKWINHYQYVDSMKRVGTDSRPDFDEQHIINTSLIWNPAHLASFRFSASIRDVLNESRTYPSISQYTYADGMPKTGRTWRLTAMWDF